MLRVEPLAQIRGSSSAFGSPSLCRGACRLGVIRILLSRCPAPFFSSLNLWQFTQELVVVLVKHTCVQLQWGLASVHLCFLSTLRLQLYMLGSSYSS